MIKILDYEIPNSPHDMTVEQWEKVSRLVNKPTEKAVDYFNKWCDVFETVGLPEEVWEEFDADSFHKAVKDFNDFEPIGDELQREIELDGFTYKTYEDKYFTSVKDLKHIERRVTSGNENTTAYILAVIFKRTDLTKNEHYDSAHLKQKEKLFSKLPAAIAVPYVTHIGKELANAMKNESE